MKSKLYSTKSSSINNTKSSIKKNFQYKTYLNMHLEIIRENPIEYIQCRSSDDIFEAFYNDTLKYPNEVFKCVHLNSKNYVLGVEIISIGTLTSSLVHPREVFKGVLINNAASVIFIHNHISGDPEPSKNDLEITNRLVITGDILGIKVLDHIIFGSKDIKAYFSFAEQKLL